MRWLVLFCCINIVWAEEPTKVLTLEDILKAEVVEHPNLQLIQAAIDSELASLSEENSSYDITASLIAEARIIEPSEYAIDQSRHDHRIRLAVSKQLYDFGRSRYAQKSADLGLQSSRDQYLVSDSQHRLLLIKLFYSVILADLRFYWDNEAMTMAYLRFDRARNRHELGQVSDVDLLALESEYQKLRRVYFSAQAQQQKSRLLLSNALNLGDKIVTEIETPNLGFDLTNLPEVKEIKQRVITNNVLLRAQRAKVKSTENKVLSISANKYPSLGAQFDLAAYARDAGGFDPWRFSVILDVPLLSGGGLKAQVARERAILLRKKSELKQLELALTEKALELRLLLDSLKVAREQVKKQIEYQLLYFDRSQALYELEVKSDLGDAMSRISEAKYQAAKVEFQLMFTWAKLQALTGQKISSTKMVL